MRKFFLLLMVMFFPWIVMLIEDNPVGALLTLIFQATIIGWIPASIWAWQEVNQKNKAKHREHAKKTTEHTHARDVQKNESAAKPDTSTDLKN